MSVNSIDKVREDLSTFSGTLKDYVNHLQEGIQLAVLKKWCTQILHGIAHLHAQNPPIIHRDLRCENIFINGSTGEVRIGNCLSSEKRTFSGSVKIAPYSAAFWAPEIYEENYSESVDIYAFGMCVLEMVTKEFPYAECPNDAQIWKCVTQGQKPAALRRIHDQELRSFIGLCLQPENRRLSAKDLLQSPFLDFSRFQNENDLRVITITPPSPQKAQVEQKSQPVATVHFDPPVPPPPPFVGANDVTSVEAKVDKVDGGIVSFVIHFILSNKKKKVSSS